MSKFILMLLAVFAAASANATIGVSSSKTVDKQAVDMNSPFEEQKKSIEADLADGETYREISSEDREAVRSALRRISDALSRSGSVENLSASEKSEVFNDQELANNILTRAGEDSRLVCRREKKVGSHRTTTQCATVAERRRAAEESQKALRDNQRIMAPKAG